MIPKRRRWLLVWSLCICALIWMPMTADAFTPIKLKPGIPVKPIRLIPFGEQLWSKQVGQGNETAPAIGPDGTVYMHVVLGFLVAYNPDGTVKWTQSGFSYITSITVRPDDGTVYVTDDYKLYAYTPARSLKWSISLPYSTPPLLGRDGTIYVVTNLGERSTLQAVTPSGKIKGHLDLDQTSSTVGGAIGTDGTIYLGGNHGTLYAVSPQTTVTITVPSIGHLPAKIITRLTPIPHLKWKTILGGGYASLAFDPNGTLYAVSNDHHLYKVNPSTGAAAVLFTGNGMFTNTPAIGADHTIYAAASDRFYALNPNGAVKWSYQTHGTVTTSATLDAMGKVYFGSNDNYLYVLYTDGTVLWKYKTGGTILHTPVIDPVRPVDWQPIYIVSDDGKLYAVRAPGSA
ncbi:PQQ-binding-like beta-propeller repeat protein [Paenibacillus sp. OV219]|uniref:outer membrane protein assembly factor BamB family protein n=1 Tax=Paenibacillus sp. OV219 TaxID=1884377 RepID=UPI0008ABE748|nr:PQQ-binding-like beta-propeller repeat protein [Paenibacillus sp. OV219]SEN74902.1 Outer membrane protein assembly factor BamB, contains PQQ-like beta-propeller repeat [Paenibacillus sp. OV219]